MTWDKESQRHQLSSKGITSVPRIVGQSVITNEPKPLAWESGKDMFDNRRYTAHTDKGDYVITHNGTSKMSWSLDYPDGDSAFAPKRSILVDWANKHYNSNIKYR